MAVNFKINIPLIPILDCTEISPYVTAKIVRSYRTKTGLYYIHTDAYDFGLTEIKGLVSGDTLTYRKVKKIIDGVCISRITD